MSSKELVEQGDIFYIRSSLMNNIIINTRDGDFAKTDTNIKYAHSKVKNLFVYYDDKENPIEKFF